MIRVNVIESNGDFNIGKFTFSKGKRYFSRKSKDGKSLVVQSNEGKWFPIIVYYYAIWRKMEKVYEANFTPIETIYVSNYEEVKKVCGD